MLKSSFISCLSLLSLTFLAIACQKDSDNNNTPKTKTELLVQNTWKFDNAKVAGTDVSGFLDDCEKDNTITFATNGTGNIDEGATKCDPADPQTIAFTWTFESNETVIVATIPLFPGGSGDFTIISLTETQLVVSQDVDFMGTTQNAVITLKK